MKKHTIEDLAAGKVATFITDKSEIADLEKILRLAFPEDDFDDYTNYIKDYNSEYYYASFSNPKRWFSEKRTKLPTQHVKDFLNDLQEEWEPKPGEICLVEKKSPKFKSSPFELEFLAKTDFKKEFSHENHYIFYNQSKTNLIPVFRDEMKPLPQKLKLTLKQIADKFGVDVDRLEIFPDI